jgi:hypothetical protein
MKIKLYLFTSLFLIASDSFCQTRFQRIITADSSTVGNDIQQTTDGGYIIAGYAGNISAHKNGAYLVKTNTEGDTLWTKIYYENLGAEAFSVQQTADSGYILAGYTNKANVEYDLYIVKTDALGDTLWTKTYGGSPSQICYSIRQTFDGGYILTGNTEMPGISNLNVCLLKLTSTGDTSWTKVYGGAQNDIGYCVRQTADSGYIICGYTASFGAGENDAYVIKTNTTGDTVWTKTYGTERNGVANSIQQTTDSGYIICGSIATGAGSQQNVYLIKINALGDTMWTKEYGPTGFNTGDDVYQTKDSGYVMSGEIDGSGYDDAYLIKTNSHGDTLWTKAYGGTNVDLARVVKQTTDGGYIMIGNSLSFSPPSIFPVIYVIKTDPGGNTGCYDRNTNTMVSATQTMVTKTNTFTLSSPADTLFPVNTIVGNGGNDSSLCLITSINELSNDNIISIYPNPTTDQLTITGNWKANQNYILTITNLLGETIYTQAANSNQETVNCKPFSSGIYFVRLAGDKESWVGKFVKE